MSKRQIPVRHSSLWIFPLALVMNTALPRVANAEEDPSAQETAAARALAVDGLKLAKAGQCREAVDKLERAEKIRHSAMVLAKLGECYVSTGKLVQGTEALRKMLREPLPPDASAALTQAYEHAPALIQEAKASIAGITITLAGGDSGKVTLTVDGTEVPATVLGVELPVDPGEHVVEVTGAAYLKSTNRAKLAAGEKQAIQIELKPNPEAALQAKAADEPPVAPGPRADSAGSGSRSRFPSRPPIDSGAQPVANSGSGKTLAFISYGVGALGIGAGVLFGRSAMQDKDVLDGQCPNKVCPPEQQDRLNSAKTKGIVATAGFGVGAAGIVLGTILLATGGSSSSSSAAASAAPPTRTLFRPRAAIGFNSVQIGADF